MYSVGSHQATTKMKVGSWGPWVLCISFILFTSSNIRDQNVLERIAQIYMRRNLTVHMTLWTCPLTAMVCSELFTFGYANTPYGQHLAAWKKYTYGPTKCLSRVATPGWFVSKHSRGRALMPLNRYISMCYLQESLSWLKYTSQYYTLFVCESTKYQ